MLFIIVYHKEPLCALVFHPKTFLNFLFPILSRKQAQFVVIHQFYNNYTGLEELYLSKSNRNYIRRISKSVKNIILFAVEGMNSFSFMSLSISNYILEI